jgi:hypothetical protein
MDWLRKSMTITKIDKNNRGKNMNQNLLKISEMLKA